MTACRLLSHPLLPVTSRCLVWITICGLIGSVLALPGSASEANSGAPGNEDAAVREFLSRVAAACGAVGKGTVRVLVVPVQLLTPSDAAPSDAPEPAEEKRENEASEKKPWIPNTMVEGRMTSAADLAYEIERLRTVPGSGAVARSGAPTPVLLAVLEASQRAAEREGAHQSRSSEQSGIQLGPGKPWNPQEIVSARAGERTVPPVKIAGGERSPLPAPGRRVAAMSPGAQKKDDSANPSNHGGRRLVKPALGRDRADKPSLARSAPVGTEGRTEPEAAVESGGPEYVAVVFRGPFHVFDENPGETFLIELDGEQVGRVREAGKEWAWLQLDSGLMGVMRKKYLRTATAQEVQQFLDLEGVAGAQGLVDGFDIGVIDLDANGLPIQSETGESGPVRQVGGGRSSSGKETGSKKVEPLR